PDMELAWDRTWGRSNCLGALPAEAVHTAHPAAAPERSPDVACAARALDRADEGDGRSEQRRVRRIASSPGFWASSLGLAWVADNHRANGLHRFRRRELVRAREALRLRASGTAARPVPADIPAHRQEQERGEARSGASRRQGAPSPARADHLASAAAVPAPSDTPVRSGGGSPGSPSASVRCSSPLEPAPLAARRQSGTKAWAPNRHGTPAAVPPPAWEHRSASAPCPTAPDSRTA